MLLISFASVATVAQNIQLHYDLGNKIYTKEEGLRQNFTITVENFSADKLGTWFYFVDIDFTSRFTEGAYTEISREFTLGKQSPFAVHLEYDGGLNRFGSFQQAALIGGAWNGHSADYTSIYTVALLYKQYFKSYDTTRNYPSIQLMSTWNILFAGGALSFSGFIDLWRGEKSDGSGQLVMLTEPQIWFNLKTLPFMKDLNLSVGSEVEMSYNFIYNTYSGKQFFVNPTLAVKWNF